VTVDQPSRPRKRNVFQTWFAAIAVLSVTAGAIISLVLINNFAVSEARSAQVIQTQANTAHNLASTVDELRKQLKSNGLDPVAPPASDIVGNLPAASGTTGPRGFTGDGINTVSCGVDGEWHFYFTSGKDQAASGPCVAKDGAAGESIPGTPGRDGKDGTDGAAGATGETGPPGPTCAPGTTLEIRYVRTRTTSNPLEESQLTAVAICATDTNEGATP